MVDYYHNDALGSTRLVTSSPYVSSSKSVLFSDSYQPYGQDNTASGSETYKFTGKPYSAATGFYYDYQRWYDPSTGRFISQDPLPGFISNPKTLNPYVYVVNSPTTLVDPSGAYAGSPTGACADYCGEPPGADFLLGAFILLGTADMHYHLGGLGENTGSICERCENVNRDIGPVDNTGTREPDPTTGESDIGPGGVRPVQIGKMGLNRGLDSIEVGPDEVDLEVRTQTSLGGRVEDAYVRDGPYARSIFESKYSVRGAAAPASERNLLQADKDNEILQRGGMIVNGQWVPVQRSIWYLPYGGAPDLIARLKGYGIQIVP